MFAFLIQSEPNNTGFAPEVIWDPVYQMFMAAASRLPYVIAGIVVFVVFLLIASVLKRVVGSAGERTRLDPTLAQLLGRVVSFAIIILGVFVGAVVVFPTFRPGDLVAGLGITSVAIGFAFKDVLQNFFAGILILWRRPFIVGDQLKFKEYEGTVEEINVRSTRIKTFDGERAVIPNGDIYANPVLVKTAYDKRRVKFAVGIGYPESIEEARRTISRVLSETEGVLQDPGPWVYVSELAASSVNFTVYLWTASQQAIVLKMADRVATGIKLALDRVGIDMPYPHNVVILRDAGFSPSGGGRLAENEG